MGKFKNVFLLTSIGVIATVAHAKSNIHNMPHGFINHYSVIQVQRDARDDQIVMLRGRLTNYFGDDIYEFTDTQGNSIEVELDDDQNWSFIEKDQLIDIIGKVDKDYFKVKIDVKDARVCK